MSDEKNIYQRINAVMKDVTYVQKDKDVTGGGQNYKAVTHDKVISVVRESLVKHGIVVYPVQEEGALLIQRDVTKDVKMHLYSGTYLVHFVNVDKPEEMATVRVQAHANDNGDKAPGKAATYATKTAILKMFSLETGEDDESRAVIDRGVDVDACLMEIDAINDLEVLRNKHKELAALCVKTKDQDAWKSLKAAMTIRAEELKGAQ